MIDFYAEIRLVHITAVIASGSLFAMRGFALNLGGEWAMAAPLRFLSYSIDTVLLTAALMLMTVVQQYPGVDAWLTMKVALLVVYIGLGSFALKRGRDRSTRVCCLLLALLVYGFIVSIARTHDPLGLFSGLAGA